MGHGDYIGDGGNGMGEYLQSVNLGSGRSVLDFIGGDKHTVRFLFYFQLKKYV